MCLDTAWERGSPRSFPERPNQAELANACENVHRTGTRTNFSGGRCRQRCDVFVHRECGSSLPED
jgi:hypothetical protein